MSIKVELRWTHVEQKTFRQIKQTVSHNNLLAYQNANKRFDIHTNSSGFQLGLVIIQEVKMAHLYIIKLTETQKRYMVILKELPRIVKTLK